MGEFGRSKKLLLIGRCGRKFWNLSRSSNSQEGNEFRDFPVVPGGSGGRHSKAAIRLGEAERLFLINRGASSSAFPIKAEPSTSWCWRRESFLGRPWSIFKLQISRCPRSQTCHDCRGTLSDIARRRRGYRRMLWGLGSLAARVWRSAAKDFASRMTPPTSSSIRRNRFS